MECNSKMIFKCFRWNLHTVTCTDLKGLVQCILAVGHTHLSPHVSTNKTRYRTFPSPWNFPPVPFPTIPYLLWHPPPVKPLFDLCHHRQVCLSRICINEILSTDSLFHSAQCFSNSSMLFGSLAHSFLLLKNIQLCEYATIFLLIDIGLFPVLGH